MAINVKKLLSKDRWTGKEVGRALLQCFIHEIRHGREENFKPLFRQEDLNLMVASITSKKDSLDYGIYKRIHQAILQMQREKEALGIQLAYGAESIQHFLMSLTATEKGLAEQARTPLLLKREQLERYTGIAKKALEAEKVTFGDVLLEVLRERLSGGDPNTGLPQSVEDELKRAEKEPIENMRILYAYNFETGTGFNIYSDGTDSKTGHEEEKAVSEWYSVTEALDKDISSVVGITGRGRGLDTKRLAQLNLQSLFFYGLEGLKSRYRKVAKADWEYSGEDTGLIMRELESMAAANTITDERYERIVSGLAGGCIWKADKPPMGLPKINVLRYATQLYREHMHEFTKDFPELYRELSEYLKNAIPSFRNLAGQKIKNILLHDVPLKELAEIGLCGYRDRYSVTSERIAAAMIKAERMDPNGERAFRIMDHAKSGGIAVIQEGGTSETSPAAEYITIENAFIESIDRMRKSGIQQRAIRNHREVSIIPSIKSVLAFNALMTAFSRAFRIKELLSIQLDTSGMERTIHGMNCCIMNLYCSAYGSEAERKEKRAFIKDSFKIIDFDSMRPAAEAIDRIAQEMKDLGFSQTAWDRIGDIQPYLSELMESGSYE